MRILCLTARLPYPPNRGDRLRAFHFIRKLSERHRLTLVSFVADAEEEKYRSELAAYCEAIHLVRQSRARSALTVLGQSWRPLPLQVAYYHSRPMRRLVNQLLARQAFDVAYIHLLRMAPYLWDAPSSLYRVLDLTDVISREIMASLPFRGLLRRNLFDMEARRLVEYEQRLARQFEETWLISAADRQALCGECEGINVQVVPNGIDTAQFRPLPGRKPGNQLTFVGHMSVYHNVDAAEYLAREILPLVRRAIPDARLNLVGTKPVRRVRRLAAVPDVSVPGYVADLNGLLNETTVFVAPLRFSAGVQNKVLEAMAAGVPVVATPNVNEGMLAEPGREILLAEDAAGLGAAVVGLLRDDDLRQRIGLAGRAFVERHFRWDMVLERMEQIARRL
jgi:sugar transferase (PEP-CTERM/EpsH1 system associated)